MSDKKTWERDGRLFSAFDVVSALKALEDHNKQLAWVGPDLATTIVRDFPDCAVEVITLLVYLFVDAEKEAARTDWQLKESRARLRALSPAESSAVAPRKAHLPGSSGQTLCGRPMAEFLMAEGPSEATCRFCLRVADASAHAGTTEEDGYGVN